jgi:hypothetical protein
MHVEMLKRIDCGNTTVRVSYSVQPAAGAAFETAPELRDAGVRTDAAFADQKARLLGDG